MSDKNEVDVLMCNDYEENALSVIKQELEVYELHV